MKTKKLFSMAALAIVGAMMTGCSNDDDILQPENKSNVETLTTTVGFDGGATTRGLGKTGQKYFRAGETMAVVYKNTSGNTVKAVSAALQDNGDIINEGKNATFTFTLTNPDKTQDVTYVYPASMANDDGTINYAALNSQNGNLSTLASQLDLATKSGAWSGGNLPSLTLDNQLAILAIKFLDGTWNDSEITWEVTHFKISDGTNTYEVNSSNENPIYVAIRPTTNATITVSEVPYGPFTCDTKTLNNKTYEAGKGYSVSWRVYY